MESPTGSLDEADFRKVLEWEKERRRNLEMQLHAEIKKNLVLTERLAHLEQQVAAGHGTVAITPVPAPDQLTTKAPKFEVPHLTNSNTLLLAVPHSFASLLRQRLVCNTRGEGGGTICTW